MEWVPAFVLVLAILLLVCLGWAKIWTIYRTFLESQFLLEISGDLSLCKTVPDYAQLLSRLPRGAYPRMWAQAQHELGISLLESNDGNPSIESLEKAVGAFREALKERTLDENQSKWVNSQENLGLALSALYQRTPETEALNTLRAASNAFRDCLSVVTPEQPNWVRIQYNLGTSLLILGQHLSDAVLLNQAVEALSAALTATTDIKLTTEWAMCQSNLGQALECLGNKENSIERLRESMVAYQASLTVFALATDAASQGYGKSAEKALERLSQEIDGCEGEKN